MQHYCPTRFPFDSDLTDYILTTLVDLRSLESFVLSSKFVYNVFSGRRLSILCAVISNQLGPAIPAAMRLLKVMTDVDSLPLPVNELSKEDDFRPSDLGAIVAPLSTRQVHVLAVNHDVVCELEALYSWRNKDPRSSLSRLTPHESELFQTALYRVWFICALFGGSATANPVGRGKFTRSPEWMEIIQRHLDNEQAKCLRSFAPFQIIPLLETWEFMEELAEWTISSESLVELRNREDGRSLQQCLVWSGPRTTLQAFRGKITSADLNVASSLVLRYTHFVNVFNTRRFSKHRIARILTSPDETFLSKLKCQQCARGPRFGSWSVSNWSYLRGISPPSKFYVFLGFNWWPSYTDPESLKEICRNTPYAELIDQVFALRSKVYRNWKPEHWLCTACLKRFIRNNLGAYIASISHVPGR